ncbi:MAG: phosphoribosylformylglycinamidine synthase subunit PurQ [Limnochordales bacterium]|nr:phosphoribosylformylglycinamidine synthase subunit PurQ [Limnochordales bacterium]
MSRGRVGVVIFPGSNCDQDCIWALEQLGFEAVPIWHQSLRLSGLDGVILPGGFSYGDYLRAGAIARFSPVMQAVAAWAKKGMPVLGICNGFQILCEAGLLPGALLPNLSRRFQCEEVYVRVENTATAFTRSASPGMILRLPIAHAQGRFFAPPAVLAELERNGQVVFRYTSADGTRRPESNPNGSVNDIAGICNREGNVVGMMPHPERVVHPLLGGEDGRVILLSLAGVLERVL